MINSTQRVSKAKEMLEIMGKILKHPQPYIQKVMNDPETFKRLYRRFGPIKKEYRKRLSMTLYEWLRYHELKVLGKQCYWMGIRTLKNPLDVWIYQEILYKIKPDIVIEIGSKEGGSTLFLAQILELIGCGKVISLDITREWYKVEHNRIIEITGDSSSPEVLSKVSKLCEGKSVFIIHDSDHRKEQVLKDLKSYSQFVSVGSYFIVEDSLHDLFNVRKDDIGFYINGGPMVAIEEFLSKNSDFVVDADCERYIITQNPKGFLKRVR